MEKTIIIRHTDGRKAKVKVPLDFDPAKKNDLPMDQIFPKVREQDKWRISDRGYEMIKKHEEFKTEAYADEGEFSIGYGSRGIAKEGDKISEPAAAALMRKHADKTVLNWMKENITVNLNPNQVDAVASLIYNVGVDQFKNSQAFKHLNEGNFAKFKQQAFDPDQGFTKVTRNGQKLTAPGLIGRRADEEQYFDSGVQ